MKIIEQLAQDQLIKKKCVVNTTTNVLMKNR